MLDIGEPRGRDKAGWLGGVAAGVFAMEDAGQGESPVGCVGVRVDNALSSEEASTALPEHCLHGTWTCFLAIRFPRTIKNHEGLTNLLISALYSDIVAVSILQAGREGQQASTADIEGLFKAASLMTNHICNKQVRELKCTFEMWGSAIRRRKVPSMGDGDRGISGRAPYMSRDVRGGGGRGFGR